MKKNFKNNLAPKIAGEMKSPWDFTCPKYDERTSCYVNAGNHSGVGHRQPVGTTKHSSFRGVPVGKDHGMTVTQVPVKNLDIEVQH